MLTSGSECMAILLFDCFYYKSFSEGKKEKIRNIWNTCQHYFWNNLPFARFPAVQSGKQKRCSQQGKARKIQYEILFSC